MLNDSNRVGWMKLGAGCGDLTYYTVMCLIILFIMYNIFIYIICSNHLICLNICYTASSCVRYHTPTAPVQVEQVTGHGWHGTSCCATVPCLLDLHKGADMISMDGFDCGGHPGHFLGLTSSAVGLAWSNVILSLCVCVTSLLCTSRTSLTSTTFYPFMWSLHVPSRLIFVKSSAYLTICLSLIEYVENSWLLQFGQLKPLAYLS